MQELISPELSERLVPLFALFLALAGGVLGWRAFGVRGLVGLLGGPLVVLLWRFHVWITGYNPTSGQLGLDQVKILVLEVLMFVALGVGLGWFWARLSAFSKQRTEERN